MNENLRKPSGQTSWQTDLIELAFDVKLGMFGLGVLQLYRDLVPGGDVCCDVDVAKASASNLPPQSVSSRDPNVHFA